MTDPEVPAEALEQLVSRLKNVVRVQTGNAFPDDPHGTITGTVFNLDKRFPDEIYKPSRGLFRLTQFREGTPGPAAPVAATPQKIAPSVRESDFYEPFAAYLVNELEECTVAVGQMCLACAEGGDRVETCRSD